MAIDPQQFKQQMLNLMQWHQDRGVLYPFELPISYNDLHEDSVQRLEKATTTPNTCEQESTIFYQRHGDWPANLIFICLASDSSNDIGLLAEEWHLYQRIEAAATNAGKQHSKQISCCLYVINQTALQDHSHAAGIWHDLMNYASATKTSPDPIKILIFGRAAGTKLAASCPTSVDRKKVNITHDLASLLKQPALKKDTWEQLQTIIMEI